MRRKNTRQLLQLLENGKEGLNELNALSHPGNFLVITTKFGLKNSVEREENEAKKRMLKQPKECSVLCVWRCHFIQCWKEQAEEAWFLSNVERREHPTQYRKGHQREEGGAAASLSQQWFTDITEIGLHPNQRSPVQRIPGRHLARNQSPLTDLKLIISALEKGTVVALIHSRH